MRLDTGLSPGPDVYSVTIRVTSEDGTRSRSYHVTFDGRDSYPHEHRDCTFDMFESVTVTPERGTFESLERRGCRVLVATVRGGNNYRENHKTRGDVMTVAAEVNDNYPDAKVYMNWWDMYAQERFSRELPADAELRLYGASTPNVLQLSVRVPKGTLHGSAVARTSGQYEYRNYTLQVVRKPGGGSDEGKSTQAPLTAEVQNAPASHDGSTAFSFQILFSEDIDIEPDEMRDDAIKVSHATVTAAARVDGRDDLWELTIAPKAPQAISIQLRGQPECTQDGAICTADGKQLAANVTHSVAYEAPQAALTASFENVPASHDGSSIFTFELEFSEAPEVGYLTLRDAALSASGGTVRRARRVVKGQNDRWEIHVEPSGNGAVTVSLAATTGGCSDAGAICTADGTALSEGATATIQGPSAQERQVQAPAPALPTLSIADATVEEGANKPLVFRITLSEASAETVTVVATTSDGSAVAGEDYRAKSKTFTFEPGRTRRALWVKVLDDDHDEDSETMTATLSSPSGATVADGTATGTITNADPMPQAWLARFGRTVADQVLDAVRERMAAPRTGGTALTLGGQRIGGEAAAWGGELDSAPADADAGLGTLAAWLRGAEGEEGDALGFETRAVTGRELLTGSSFSLSGGGADGGFGALWGRAAVSHFDGREDDLTLDGEVASGMLGADWAAGSGSVGLILSHSRGEGGYRSEAGDGAVETTLTGLYPWGRFEVSRSLALWGAAGYGTGSLTLVPEGAARIETDTSLRMAAVGGRSVVAEAPAEGGLELSVTSDAMTVRTSSGEVRGSGGNLAASAAEATRLRLGLEGTWRRAPGGGAGVTPSFEIGLRRDGGDAEAGWGADIGVGLDWADPAQGIRADLRARGLLTHDDGGFRERGFAGSLTWDPDPASARGPSLTISQTVGARASGGVEHLWAQGAPADLARSGNEMSAAFGAEVGYGLSVAGADLLTPYAGLALSDGGARTYRVGGRLALGPSFGASLEGDRRERRHDAPDHGLMLRGVLRW